MVDTMVLEAIVERRGSSSLPRGTNVNGGLAHLVEHLLCKQRVRSSNLLTSTSYRGLRQRSDYQAHNLGDGGSNPSPATS